MPHSMELAGKIESILFVASKPLTIKRIARALGEQEDNVLEAIQTLITKYNHESSGIYLLHEGEQVQMASNPAHASVIEGFVKDEISGELTRAQLETLTVIAYRGPITRPELEQIRGVNCAIIIRNLLVRGLIEEMDDAKKMMPTYVASVEALRHMGVSTTNELPDYDALHAHEHVERILDNPNETA